MHDWLLQDPSFKRAFIQAKVKHDDAEFRSLDGALSLVTQIIRPIVPANLWPRITSELTLAVVNLKQDLKVGGRRKAVPSGNVAEVSLSPRTFEDVAIHGRDGDASADNL